MNYNKGFIMKIDNFYLESCGTSIFCTLVTSEEAKEECIIYFSPIFEERMWSQRIAFNFAKKVCTTQKKAVLLFDYYGYGESDGDVEEFSLKKCRSDTEVLMSFLIEKGFSKVAIWGIRTGAAVAINSLKGFEDNISTSFYWAPVFDLEDYILGNLRGSVAAQYMLFKKIVAKRDEIIEELINTGRCEREGYQLNFIDGYRIGREFYQETSSMLKEVNIKNYKYPLLFISMYKNRLLIEKKKQILFKEFSDEEKKELTHLHIEGEDFWQIRNTYSQRAENLYDMTLEWMKEIN